MTTFWPFFGIFFFIWSTVAPEDFMKGKITSPAIEKPRPPLRHEG
jgi:hypothetical protein